MTGAVMIIGAGNMGSSLARGLRESGFDQSRQVMIYDVNPEKTAQFLNKGYRTVVVSNLPDDVSKAEVVVLCTKPQDLESVGAIVANRISPNTLLISIAAGVPVADIESLFSFNGAVVRVMPNIAATVRCAATAMCCNGKCNEGHKKIAEEIFGAVGEAYWIKESLLDAVTGLSGSGPAYIYMVIEALTDGGVKMGIPRDLAAKLSVQTVLGSAMLVKKTGLHPAILKDQVTTPGGTTICAIHELEAHGLRSMLISAVATATERSALLRKNSKKS